jgi:hypothetical protein
MDSKITAWASHSWAIMIPGILPIRHACRHCGRMFVDDDRTGERYAITGGTLRLERLSDEVTNRWLDGFCPGRPLLCDEDDLKTRFGGTSMTGTTKLDGCPDPQKKIVESEIAEGNQTRKKRYRHDGVGTRRRGDCLNRRHFA